MRLTFLLPFIPLTAMLAQGPPNVTVVATGLSGPMKLARTPAGNLLVTDAGRENHTGRLSLVTRAGSRTTVLEGLPAAVAAEGTSGPTAIEVAGSVVGPDETRWSPGRGRVRRFRIREARHLRCLARSCNSGCR